MDKTNKPDCQSEHVTTPTTRDEINRAEWQNPDNWSSIYFSKKDSRSYVPKKNPRHGWTINFGSKAGSRWIYYLLALFLMLGFILGLILSTVLISPAG